MVMTLSTCKSLHIASYLRLVAAFGHPASRAESVLIFCAKLATNPYALTSRYRKHCTM